MVDIKLEKIFQIHGSPVSAHFSLKKGITILTGENGVGKSTFFHYLKNHRAQIFGNFTCAFMDQFPLAPLSELRGKDIINILQQDLQGFDAAFAHKFLDEARMTKLLENTVESYSGGENQMFKFALLISQKAQFYFLDEPLQYLDNQNIIKLLTELRKRDNKYILIIEHRKEKIEEYTDHSLTMKNINNSIMIGI